jgi:hypothetical protein
VDRSKLPRVVGHRRSPESQLGDAHRVAIREATHQSPSPGDARKHRPQRSDAFVRAREHPPLLGDLPDGSRLSRAYQPLFGKRRSIHLMEKRHLFSHAQAEQILRRAGFHQEQIDEVLRDLPDPIDIERDGGALVKHGVSREQLIDRLGGSP